ncbi:MAG: dihydrofolate reductase [Phycisphaerae bacterium]
MSSIVCYIAVSMDGFIATADGGVDWLNPFDDALAGFRDFDASIGASVMGRETYEFMRKHLPPAAPQDRRRTVVLTRRPLGDVPANTTAHAGDIPPLAAELKAAAAGRDVWLVGGGQAIRAFLDADAIDRWRLFVVPVMLGDGKRLLAPGQEGLRAFTLTNTHTFASGVVELAYDRRRA